MKTTGVTQLEVGMRWTSKNPMPSSLERSSATCRIDVSIRANNLKMARLQTEPASSPSAIATKFKNLLLFILIPAFRSLEKNAD